jgi:pimeloyl-ACP methyl ester carboxylesterase
MARIVLVHGAFGQGAVWGRVAPGLRDAGHDVEAIDLPGQGDDPTPVAEVTLDRYAERVCEALSEGSQPVAPFLQPVRTDGNEAFANLPRAYVTCLQDNAIRPALQRLMFERAGCDPVIEIDTDHCPWASRPDELAAALNRLAA